MKSRGFGSWVLGKGRSDPRCQFLKVHYSCQQKWLKNRFPRTLRKHEIAYILAIIAHTLSLAYNYLKSYGFIMMFLPIFCQCQKMGFNLYFVFFNIICYEGMNRQKNLHSAWGVQGAHPRVWTRSLPWKENENGKRSEPSLGVCRTGGHETART